MFRTELDDKVREIKPHSRSRWEHVTLHGWQAEHVVYKCPFCGELSKSDYVKCPACKSMMFRNVSGVDEE